jgi:hypothetical protein
MCNTWLNKTGFEDFCCFSHRSITDLLHFIFVINCLTIKGLSAFKTHLSTNNFSVHKSFPYIRCKTTYKIYFHLIIFLFDFFFHCMISHKIDFINTGAFFYIIYNLSSSLRNPTLGSCDSTIGNPNNYYGIYCQIS